MSLKGVMARRGEAVRLPPHTMSRNTASAPFRPSRRAPRGVRTVGMPPALRAAFPWPQRHLPLLGAGHWANATCSEAP